MTILTILAAALLNRWRGGGWPFLPGEIHGGPNDKKRTQVRRIPLLVLFGLATYLAIGNRGYAFTLPLIDLDVFTPIWLLVCLATYASLLTGFGFPVSAAIGKRGKLDYEDEFAPLDAAAHFMASTRVGGYTSTYYGVAWLTLHGLLFGALAAAALASPFPLIWAGMGFCYYLAKDWERGELYDGALKGLGIATALMHTFNQ